MKTNAKTKKCTKCQIERPIGLFYYNKTSETRGHHASWCCVCVRAGADDWSKRNPDKVREHQRIHRIRQRGRYASDKAYREKRKALSSAYRKSLTPEQRTKANLAKTLMYEYGLTIDQYNRLLDAFGRACGMCGDPRNLVIDHDHSTGDIRGILCNSCNSGLGLIGDTMQSVLRAYAYLKMPRIRESGHISGRDYWDVRKKPRRHRAKPIK